ncbi:TIR domain-containing protein [Rhizobium sp. CB3090]|uniref:TIR domain-containing protein n=1 Tax=Rhizobium sp. CB3090 TaxID=3039156 RepID=UPI0024B0B192|nr:TIR domain-containing protein [Rhizobium sp. CB3090]WFU08484.1 TIR domain-containing protein [Rhizobium sp. CB3090]
MQLDDPLIFISYASEDRPRVTPFVDYLTRAGLDTWLDVRRIKGGANWDIEIRRALDKCQIIVVFISNKSVSKRGFVQREMKLALEKAEEKLVDDIYVVPVILDSDAPYPDQLKGIQYISADDDDCNDKLLDAIRHQLDRLGASVQQAQQDASLTWTFSKYKESQNGIPGYEIEFRAIKFESEKYEHVHEIGEVIKGDLVRCAMDFRSTIMNPVPEHFNYGQDRYSRTNTLDVTCSEPRIVGRMLSISYMSDTYYAGAAHPNHHSSSYVFVLDPLHVIQRLESLFNKEEDALVVIRDEARRQLLAPREGEDPAYSLDEEWVHRGTESWDHFRTFGFSEEGLELTFDPYQVAAYAYGHQFVRIEYRLIDNLLKREIRSTLDRPQYF